MIRINGVWTNDFGVTFVVSVKKKVMQEESIQSGDNSYLNSGSGANSGFSLHSITCQD
ncbi:unnamed protein product [Arabidopsis thaliana]|uniref:(thale cress) hypothetical protein n=1 Tax=Arabidopsis thaliana TaxID=3702 RepID=A0A7G2F9R6_ARATH|nr:unnamed protein product [Arabidopsis thaliana]